VCLKSLKWFTASVEDEQTSVEHEQRSVWRLVYVQNRVHVVYRSYSYFSIFSSIMTIFNQLPLNRWRMTMIDNESSESTPSDSSKPSWILYLQSWTNDVESLLSVNLSTSISTSQPVRCPDTWRYSSPLPPPSCCRTGVELRRRITSRCLYDVALPVVSPPASHTVE
jgi:hypothetical protein